MTVKKILVTGSSGTVGTRFCEKLIERGYAVTGLDRVPNAWNPAIDKITLRCDLLDRQQIDKLPGGFDAVIHFAANARVYDLVVDPDRALENIVTTHNVLEYCRKQGITRALFSSSREVYGNSEKITHTEEDVEVELAESPYSASKLAGEALFHSYAKCYGLGTVIVRFSNVYGMYDDSDRLVPLFTRNTLAGKQLAVFGKDKMLDFTYIDDTVAGVMACIEKFDAVAGETFNLASGVGSKLIDVGEMIQAELGVQKPIQLKDNRPGEVVKYVADISKARRMLGYEPKIGIRDGIRKSIEWYKKYRTDSAKK